ncbi:MAG: glutathione S-transferase N-terminal domain-containing protein [Pseudomonadota bacterium]
MAKTYTLFGMAGSLYTAKVRSYLRQQGIDFIERPAGDLEFIQRIVPQIGRWIIPVVEAPGGDVLQDGTAILDHFESSGEARSSVFPNNAVLRAVAHVFELFGGEGLLRPAMHYRWSFDDENLNFIRDVFRDALPFGRSDDERATMFEFSSGRMRQAANFFGVVDETKSTIEASYKDFLSRLNAHFDAYPFLLGSAPTIGDFALMGPLYAHMGRDPVPLRLMQTDAPRVFRWTERMNAPERILDETARLSEATPIDPEALPETLISLLSFVAEDYLPELSAHVAFANQWLDARPDLAVGTNGLEDPAARSIGKAAFEWRGHQIETAVMPYRFWLLQRLHAVVDHATEPDRRTIGELFARTGLAPLLELRTSRRVERAGFLEVWGDVVA